MDNYIFYRDILAIGGGWIIFGLIMIAAGISDWIDDIRSDALEDVCEVLNA